MLLEREVAVENEVFWCTNPVHTRPASLKLRVGRRIEVRIGVSAVMNAQRNDRRIARHENQMRPPGTQPSEQLQNDRCKQQQEQRCTRAVIRAPTCTPTGALTLAPTPAPRA